MSAFDRMTDERDAALRRVEALEADVVRLSTAWKLESDFRSALERELAEVRGEIAALTKMYRTGEDDYRTLRAENAALQEDAERLNWSERQWANGIHIEYCAIGIGDVKVTSKATVFYGSKEASGASIRAAIDAARKP